MENQRGMTSTGKTEELGEIPVPVPLCPPQIQYGLTLMKLLVRPTGYICSSLLSLRPL
jgi:hypothetical protein